MHPIEWLVSGPLPRASRRVLAWFRRRLVVLDANPLLDIRNTQRIHAVTVRGRFIDSAERLRMLAAVETAAQETPSTAGAVRHAGCCH